MTPEGKALHADRMRSAWQDPEMRARFTPDPERLAAMRAGYRRYMAAMTPEQREARRQGKRAIARRARTIHAWQRADQHEREGRRTMPEPTDPQLAAMLREALPRFERIGDDPDAIELLVVTVTCELPIRRALLAVRGYVVQYGLSAEMAGQLALITDALVKLDPELGPPETLAARLAILVGVQPREVVQGRGVAAIVPV